MKKYGVILADPPWMYTSKSVTPNREVTNHYSVMTTPDICSMPISSLCADNAVLFLWSTWPHLPDAFDVIDSWGFEYKTIAWVWVKAKSNGFGFHWGMGAYTRANSEPCLLAVRGKPPTVADRSIQSVIYSPVRKHSKKPEDQYRKIESLYPEATYLELFARRSRPGWDVFGNEVENSIVLPEATP